MAYWIRWHAANGEQGPRIGPFDRRKKAELHMQATLRQWADEQEAWFGKPGVWTADGELYCDDMFHDEAPLGRFIIEDERDDGAETPER